MTNVSTPNTDLRTSLGLRPVINVAGTMSSLGASIICPEAIAAMQRIATEWVEMDDLQRRASAVIAGATGGEAGFITACCAAAISLAVAGAITGTDLLAIERLPADQGRPNRVIVQTGQLIGYGAPVEQAIRLSGGIPVAIGTVSSTMDYHLQGEIGPETAAFLYIVTHHSSQFGMLSLDEVIAICKPRGIPVIVDAASEYDMRGFLARGADLVLYSGHKFLAGPTSGIVAGRKDLVQAAYQNNHGIGRGMKAGKESIAGAMAAIEAWARRDHAAVRARERAAIDLWMDTVAELPGLSARIVPDPTGNPLNRIEIAVRPESGFSAAGLARALAAGDRPVIVRGHVADLGILFLDPCNLHPGEEHVVAETLRRVMAAPRPAGAMSPPGHDTSAMRRWPD